MDGAALAGFPLPAGMGVATVIADFDCETYSEGGYVWDPVRNKWTCLPNAPQGKKGLPVIGMARYAEHPTTEALCWAYDLKDGRGRRRWRPGMSAPQDLFDHILNGYLIEAWNAGFEWYIWTRVMVPKHGWPPLNPRQLRCAMAKARAHNLPGPLAAAGAAIHAPVLKDPEGKRLLDLFSMPRNPTKKDPRLRIRPEDQPEDAEKLYAYNEGDIAAEAAISNRVPDLRPDDLEWWFADQEINRRGVRIDMDRVRDCIKILDDARLRYDQELYLLTGGAVARATELAAMRSWLHGQGVHTDSLDEDHVTALLRRKDLSSLARRVVEIRSLLGSSAVAKVYAIANQVCADGRLRELYSFNGARTGRPTGNGAQPMNLPNSGPPVLLCECKRHYGLHRSACPWCGAPVSRATVREWNPAAARDATQVMALRSLTAMEDVWGAAIPTLAGCLRGFFIAAKGCELIGTDYSSIEAVVLAMLAGEQWRIDVFRTHGKIYEASISRITGVPLEEYLDYRKRTGEHHPHRKRGKVAELASGFRGWINSWLNFGAGEFMTEDEIKDAVLAWRRASPSIPEMWGGQWRRTHAGWVEEFYGLEGCAIRAVLYPGTEWTSNRITYTMHGDALYCRLPSGRYLTYHEPRLERVDHYGREQWSLSYMTWNTNPSMGPPGWVRMYTHGGKLTENVVQAVACDIHRHGMVNLERAGAPLVLHTYDEFTTEVPIGTWTVEQVEAIVNVMPPWAADWPIRAVDGWIGREYRK